MHKSISTSLTTITRSILLSLFCFIISQYSYSQTKTVDSNFSPGYVVTINGDTIRGFIESHNWIINPSKIFFKEKATASLTSFTPLTCKGFGVDGNVYESATVQLEVSPYNTSELKPDRELHLENKTAFLETIVKGTKALYSLKNGENNEQYYIKNNDGFELLIYKRYIKEKDGQSSIASNTRYVNQLALYLQDYNDVQARLINTNYTKSSLKSLFIAYYEATKGKTAFVKTSEKVSITFGVMAGISFNKLTLTSDSFSDLQGSNFKQSVGTAIGGSLALIVPNTKKRWSLQNDLLLASYKVTSSINDYVDKDKFTIRDITFAYTYLKLTNMVRYTHPIKEGHLFINMGMFNGVVMAETNKLVKKTHLFTLDRTEESEAIQGTRKHEQGLSVGIGGQYKKYSLELRNESGNGMSDFVNLSSKTNRLNLLFSYSF